MDGLKDVNIGLAIDQRRLQLKMSKSELARRMGIPHQYITPMLEKASINTGRLIKASEALGFNFFTLYFSTPDCLNNALNVSGMTTGPKPDQDQDVASTDYPKASAGRKEAKLAEMPAELAHEKARVELLERLAMEQRDHIEDLKGQIRRQDGNLKDKDTIIGLLQVMGPKKLSVPSDASSMPPEASSMSPNAFSM